MRQMTFWWMTCLGTVLSLGIYWLTPIPLGIPGEWTWARFESSPELWDCLLMGMIAGALYLAFVAWGWHRLKTASIVRIEHLGWLTGLALLGGVWIWTIEGTGTSGPTVGRWPFVLYYSSSSGYFFKARYESPDARKFLREYEALMSTGDVLHVGTHPPGLFLFFHGLIGVVDAKPSWVPTINATQPATVREVFDIIETNTQQSPQMRALTNPVLNPADRAVIWLASLIVLGMSAATVWPLYGFLRFFVDRPTSWLCAAAWPLIPSAAIFLPKSDVAYAFLAITLAWLWIAAWRKSSVGLAAATGVVWSISLLCSLAFLPVALWLAVMSLCESLPAWRSGQSATELRRALWTILPAGFAVMICLGGLSYCGEIPLWKTFWWNYRNHAGFYAQYPRTYGHWLWLNPLELAGGLGWPVFLAASLGFAQLLRKRHDEPHASLWGPCLATLIVWGWLWISGKNSGEAARLWIFLMPFWLSGCAASWPMTAPTASPARWPWPALLWLGCQAVVCLLTVQRINGFSIFG